MCETSALIDRFSTNRFTRFGVPNFMSLGFVRLHQANIKKKKEDLEALCLRPFRAFPAFD
jgi:hypothetical protein